jgi:manganese efflux pump family protein
MSVLSIVLISIGLGTDAFAVAIGTGMILGTPPMGALLRMSFAFGLFQFLMPVLGWTAGMSVSAYVSRYDHWVAFFLLVFVSGKMILDAFRHEDKIIRNDPTRGMTLLLLSIATSIDALAVGLSFALLNVDIVYPSAIIGIIAFIMTWIGMIFGDRLGKLFGRKVEIIGGLILMGIAAKILMEHTM